MLYGRRALHVIARHAVRLVRNAIDGHCFVEVEMTFDEAWRDKLSASVVLGSLCCQSGLDRHDYAALHADIDRRPICTVPRNFCIPNDEIERHLLSSIWS
jgi:hypothetical protein